MSQVHAPYHFVPLSKWVYMPDWAHLVSHDHPFEDGYSGYIEYTLTNETALCVGDKQIKEKGKPTLVKWARDPSDSSKPIIPGSSLKGMIRSVLEIASFGKFANIDDKHFSYRDISKNSNYLKKDIKQMDVRSGWVIYNKDEQQWELTLCDNAKISHKRIKTELNITINNTDSAITKYSKWPLSKSVNATISKPVGVQKNRWAETLTTGSINGNIVFTNDRVIGQGNRSDYEFSYFFYNHNLRSKTIVNAQAKKLFASHNKEQVEFLQKNGAEKGIPVFALYSKDTKKLHSLGLAKMPRILYNNSVCQLADHHQGMLRDSNNYFDMAELMLGTLREQGLSLKSRISFTDSKLEVAPKIKESGSVVLNSPNATFLAAYLEQPIARQYQDYNNNSKLSGWKRYIARNKLYDHPAIKQGTKSDNNEVSSKFEYIEANNKFSGKVFFQNLKKEEVGALIWALQLGNNEECNATYHTLGHGKSLGAGAVQMRIQPRSIIKSNMTGLNCVKLNEYLTAFTELMEEQYPSINGSSWSSSPQIAHLLSLADIEENLHRKIKQYDFKEYQSFKNNKEKISPATIYGQEIDRLEEVKSQQDVPPSFRRGRLSQLVIDETDKDWVANLTDALEEQQLKRIKQEAKAKLVNQKEQAKSIDDPFQRVTTQLNLLVEQSSSDLSETAKKDINKALRDIGKTIKSQSWELEQTNSFSEKLSSIAELKEKLKLEKWLNNYHNE